MDFPTGKEKRLFLCFLPQSGTKENSQSRTKGKTWWLNGWVVEGIKKFSW